MNIIYMHTHDSGRMLSPYGVKTPTDKLLEFAKDSIVFRQAHCVSPTCSPSRASLLTGQYPHNNGMMGLAHRGFKIKDYKTHLASYLKDFGYETVLCGVQHEASLWDDLDKATEIIGYDKNITINSNSIDQEQLFNWDMENAKKASEYILNSGENKFFLSFGMFSTHRRYPINLDDIVDPRYIDIPSNIVDNEKNRLDTARYYTSAKYMDDCLGIVLDALKEKNIYEEALIIFTTDHGIANPFSKCNLFDLGTGVSLIIRNPYIKNQGSVIDSLVSHLDVFPTICDIIDIEKPSWLQGKSLIPLLRGQTKEVRDEVYAETNFHTSYEPARSIRTKRYKYIKYYDYYDKVNCSNIDDSPPKNHLLNNGLINKKKDMEAFYDLYFDTSERNNLINDKSYEKILNELKEKLYEWQVKTNDPILNGSIIPPVGSKINKRECISPSSKNKDDYELM
ncbi:sulfatase family protein [Clostridioides difficile]